MFKIYIMFVIVLLALIIVSPLLYFSWEDNQPSSGGKFTENQTVTNKTPVDVTTSSTTYNRYTQDRITNTTDASSKGYDSSTQSFTTDNTVPENNTFEGSSTINEVTYSTNNVYNLSTQDAISNETKTEAAITFPQSKETLSPTVNKTDSTTETASEDETTNSKNDDLSSGEPTTPSATTASTTTPITTSTTTTTSITESTTPITTSTTHITTSTTTTTPITTTSTTTPITTTLSTTTTSTTIESTESFSPCTTPTPLLIPLLSRKQWNPEYPDFKCIVPLAQLVNTVLIRQTLNENCFNVDECAEILKKLMTKDKSGNMLDINYNYIIGGDGVLYEARGWKCRADNTTRFYTPPIDEMFLGLTGSARENNINNRQLENMKKFLFEGSQQGTLKKLGDGYILKSFHDTSETCYCPIDQPAVVETCGPCVLKRSFPQ